MKIARETTFPRTVHALLPTDKLDVYHDETFTARFRLLTSDEASALGTEEQTVVSQLDRVLVSVDGVGDLDGNPYPADEALQIIKQNAITALATLHAYNKAVGKDIEGKTRKPSSGK